MSQSLSQINLHIIFSTKDRVPYFSDMVCDQLYPYTAKILQNHDSFVFKVGGFNDHIHIACALPKTMSAADLIGQVKSSTSKWLKQTFEDLSDFAWQHGYGVFSFSQSHKEQVVQYIGNQKEHHKTQSFQEEFVAFLEKYKTEYNEKYLWD